MRVTLPVYLADICISLQSFHKIAGLKMVVTNLSLSYNEIITGIGRVPLFSTIMLILSFLIFALFMERSGMPP
jgi:hypothetical protein